MYTGIYGGHIRAFRYWSRHKPNSALRDSSREARDTAGLMEFFFFFNSHVSIPVPRIIYNPVERAWLPYATSLTDECRSTPPGLMEYFPLKR